MFRVKNFSSSNSNFFILNFITWYVYVIFILKKAVQKEGTVELKVMKDNVLVSQCGNFQYKPSHITQFDMQGHWFFPVLHVHLKCLMLNANLSLRVSFTNLLFIEDIYLVLILFSLIQFCIIVFINYNQTKNWFKFSGRRYSPSKSSCAINKMSVRCEGKESIQNYKNAFYQVAVMDCLVKLLQRLFPHSKEKICNQLNLSLLHLVSALGDAEMIWILTKARYLIYFEGYNFNSDENQL